MSATQHAVEIAHYIRSDEASERRTAALKMRITF